MLSNKSITHSICTTEAARMSKRFIKPVVFLENLPNSSSISRREPFRGRPLTPYPHTLVSNRMFSPREYWKIIAGLGCILESAAGLDALIECDGSESETEIELETRRRQELNSNYTQSSGPKSDPENSRLWYHFPLLVAFAPRQTSDAAHRLSQYPNSSPRATISWVFSATKRAALKHFAENTYLCTLNSPDGSRSPLVYPWMTELIVDRIEARKSRILKETKPVSRKPVCSDSRKGLFRKAGIQPWLCRETRREATRVVEEAFEENDRREGLLSPEDGIIIDSISNGDTPSSRHPSSFCYSGTRTARSPSAAFPCLCKKDSSTKSVPACLPEPRPRLQAGSLGGIVTYHHHHHHHHNTGWLCTRIIWPPWSHSCDWFDILHVQPRRWEMVWQNAEQVGEVAEKVLRSDPFAF